jgi:AhpD family alkylhydroperoxidase
MIKRANYFGLATKAMQILIEQEGYLQQQFETSDTVPVSTWELIKLRISQINQCAFCIDMHSKEAMKQGESAERIFGLSAWRDMPLYSTTEQVALEWAERVTAGEPVDDLSYQQTEEVLGEQGMVDLTLAINAINAWNRVAKTFKPKF